MRESSEEEDARQAAEIADVLQRTSDIDWDPGTFLTGWVVIAEWVEPDGRRRLSRIAPPKQPGWASDGLLHAGLDWDRRP